MGNPDVGYDNIIMLVCRITAGYVQLLFLHLKYFFTTGETKCICVVIQKGNGRVTVQCAPIQARVSEMSVYLPHKVGPQRSGHPLEFITIPAAVV